MQRNEFPNKKNSDAPNRVPRFAKSATKPAVVGNESSDLDGYGEGDEALLVVLFFLAESIGFPPYLQLQPSLLLLPISSVILNKQNYFSLCLSTRLLNKHR